MLPLAHAGHWLQQVALLAPVLLLVLGLIGLSVRDQWRKRRDSHPRTRRRPVDTGR